MTKIEWWWVWHESSVILVLGKIVETFRYLDSPLSIALWKVTVLLRGDWQGQMSVLGGSKWMSRDEWGIPRRSCYPTEKCRVMVVGKERRDKFWYCVLSHFSHVWLFVIPWTVAHQVPLSMGILQARILEWVAMPSSKGSSQPRDWTQVSHTAGGFFTIWATRKAFVRSSPE